ncbi:ribonuclease H2, subunit B [Lactifluus volemus]|nr:ribonuclease H2, subunit B [Lactifluus volemus]
MTHIGVLPFDLLDTITRRMNERDGFTPTSFLQLPHPRTDIPSLFLPYRRGQVASREQENEWQILEVQCVSPPNERSWFFTEGEVLSDGRLLVMTPIDPTFLLIPILQVLSPRNGSTGIFQPLDDIFDEAAQKIVKGVNEGVTNNTSPILQEDILSLTRYDCIVGALRRICDFQIITPELTVYRYSEDRVIEYLQAKVSRLSRHTVAEKSRTIIRSLAKDGLMEDGKEDLLELGRIRSACNLVSQYVTHDLYIALVAKYDFTQLDAHVKALKDEEVALALASSRTAKSRVGVAEGDEGKKRKAKSKVSHGVGKLQKVDVSGMAKISSFFQKK